MSERTEVSFDAALMMGTPCRCTKRTRRAANSGTA